MPHLAEAFQYFNGLIPDIRKMGFRSLLYVGWRHDASGWWYETFSKGIGIERFGIIEIFKKNFDELNATISKSGWQNFRTYFGDVREIQKYVQPGEYDVIFWDHGPEHVPGPDLEVITPVLSRMTKLLIYSCPWGNWPQGAEDGNENERHYTVTDFQLRDYGFEVKTFGVGNGTCAGELAGIKVNV